MTPSPPASRSLSPPRPAARPSSAWSPRRARELCPVVLRCLRDHAAQRWSWDELLASRLPADLIERAIRLGVASTAERFRDRPRQLAAYLDCVEELRRHPVANLDAD